MFFNSAKRRGTETGEAILSILKTCFTATPYFDDMKFQPPERFFDDLYIRGFVSSYSAALLQLALGGANDPQN